MRIYYTGKGTEIEASEDEGKTFNTYIKCKTVDYGGDTFVWPPAGKCWEWRILTVKVPNMFDRGDEKFPKLQHRRSIPVVVEGDGEMDSYVDMSPQAAHAAFLAANSEGLVPENKYVRNIDPDQLRRRAEALLALADEKEGKKPVEKKRKTVLE